MVSYRQLKNELSYAYSELKENSLWSDVCSTVPAAIAYSHLAATLRYGASYAYTGELPEISAWQTLSSVARSAALGTYLRVNNLQHDRELSTLRSECFEKQQEINRLRQARAGARCMSEECSHGGGAANSTVGYE